MLLLFKKKIGYGTTPYAHWEAAPWR